jgi:acyl dehydratase
MRYFEDLQVGETATLGDHTITRDEIIAFAHQFDPQPFHLDEAQAHASIYGGLIASGWHTACLMMRLIVDGWVTDTAGMGSPGIDELRWLLPVRPGDTLTASITILELTPSTRRTDRGTVRSLCEMRNQRGEVVLRAIGLTLMARRPATE